MRKLMLVAAATALAIPAMPAAADPPKRGHDNGYHRGHYAKYDHRGRYTEPRRLTRSDRVWRGRDGRYYCERDNGTTGLIIGGALGALLGREVDGGRDRTLGTIIGAAGGALLGREVDRGDLRCR